MGKCSMVCIVVMCLVGVATESSAAGEKTSGADKAINLAINLLKKQRDKSADKTDREKLERAILSLEGMVGRAKREWTRKSFKDNMIGKTPAEIMKLLGRPFRTSETAAAQGSTWQYNLRVLDPLSGKYDESVSLVIYDDYGTVSSVYFFSGKLR